MYDRVFKNNQVTYGRPYQVIIPANLKTLEPEEAGEEAEEESAEIETPERLLKKAREEAGFIIKEAEYEAARILEAARADAERKSRDTLEEAWQKGYDEGNEAAKEQYAGIMAEAEAARGSALEEHDKVLAEMEAEIMELVADVARKVIGAELSSSRDSIIYLVRQAIDKCSNKYNLVLKVSAEDYEYLTENRDRFNEMVQGGSEMEIRRDLSLGQGACLVESQYGSIDASAQTRLCKIEEAFREILEGR